MLPQIVPFAFGEDEINAAEMVSASCTVNKGDFPIKISWLHNSQPIYANDGVSISRTNQRISILSIESVHGRHSGTYSCMAENLAGSVNFTTSLWVNGTSVQSFSKIVQAFETLEWRAHFAIAARVIASSVLIIFPWLFSTLHNYWMVSVPHPLIGEAFTIGIVLYSGSNNN